MSGRYTFTNNTQTGLGTWIGWPVDVSFPVFGSTLNGTTVSCCDGDQKKTAELVAAAGKDGTRIMSEVGSIWYKFWGNSEATAVKHSFIAMPNHTGAQVGLPEARDAGGSWVMFAGTSEAHIMLPGL